MVEGIQNREINFPADHYVHDEPVEWYYMWGRLDSGEFFHFARFWFKLGGYRTGASHFSFHNGNVLFQENLEDDFGITKDACHYGGMGKEKIERFSFGTEKMGMIAVPKCKPVIHPAGSGRNYYSIPWMEGRGHLYPDKEVKADVWFDHEFSPPVDVDTWDWVAVKLNCGMSITAYKSNIDSFCSVVLKDNRIESDYILDGKHLYIHQLASYFMLEPTEQEVVFHPKFGFRYSETPFEVIAKSGVIGFGMRERTYREKKDG